MKLKVLGMIAGSTLLGLASTNASARTDVYVDLSLGIPAPLYVESRPVYYYEHEPVYYYREYPRTYVYSPRYEVRHYERHRHDDGWHRGHHKHKRRHHHH